MLQLPRFSARTTLPLWLFRTLPIALLLSTLVTAAPGAAPQGVDPEIVYLKTSGKRTDLYRMDADGTDAAVVRTGVGRSKPVWSPNGLQVAYSGSRKVYVCNRDGSGLLQVGSSSELLPSVSWSPVPAPDGRYRIAYNSYVAATGSSEIFLVEPNGSNRMQLTATANIDEYSTSWSPDATRLAVDTWDDLGTHVELLDITSPAPGVCAVGARQTLISDPNFEVWFTGLDWGRTGERIAYASVDSATGYSELWLTPIAQPSAATLLAIGDRASWSPNDAQLVYSSGFTLHRVNADGTGRVTLGTGFYPNWRR